MSRLAISRLTLHEHDERRHTQGGGFIAAITDGLRWDAGAVQLRLLSGRFVMAAYDVPGGAVGVLLSRCKLTQGVRPVARLPYLLTATAPMLMLAGPTPHSTLCPASVATCNAARTLHFTHDRNLNLEITLTLSAAKARKSVACGMQAICLTVLHNIW